MNKPRNWRSFPPQGSKENTPFVNIHGTRIRRLTAMGIKSLAYRSFLPEFLLYMDRRGGFPRDRHMRAWFKKHRDGIKGEHLSALMTGRYAPEKVWSGVVAMLLDPVPDPATHLSRKALLDYLQARGITSPGPSDLERVATHVCTPIATTPPAPRLAAANGQHPLLMGPPALLGISIDLMLRYGVQGCRPFSDDLNQAVRWMYIAVARQTLPDGPAMPHEAAIRAA